MLSSQSKVIALIAILAVAGSAQNAPLPQTPQPAPKSAPAVQESVTRDYSKARPQFPTLIAPYRPEHVRRRISPIPRAWSNCCRTETSCSR